MANRGMFGTARTEPGEFGTAEPEAVPPHLRDWLPPMPELSQFMRQQYREVTQDDYGLVWYQPEELLYRSDNTCQGNVCRRDKHKLCCCTTSAADVLTW